MAGEIIYADLRHPGDGFSSAEKRHGKCYFGGKALISSFACFGKTFGFACFSIPMLNFPRYMENVGWIKCLR